jgi:RNA polymerase sigma-70 factor (ECF subfamily)
MEDPHKRFQACVLPYLDLLYRAALRLAGQKADAEDLVQESCLRAFAAIDQLRDVENSKAWLFRILRTTYLRKWEGDPYRKRIVGAEDLELTLSDFRETLRDPYESDPLYVHVVGVEVRKAISALPLPYREAVVLADVAKFTYREMAQILEVPSGTMMAAEAAFLRWV